MSCGYLSTITLRNCLAVSVPVLSSKPSPRAFGPPALRALSSALPVQEHHTCMSGASHLRALSSAMPAQPSLTCLHHLPMLRRTA
jgi:hypothetical protein